MPAHREMIKYLINKFGKFHVEQTQMDFVIIGLFRVFYLFVCFCFSSVNEPINGQRRDFESEIGSAA